MPKKTNYFTYKALGIAGLFFIWHISSVLYNQPYLLPGPIETIVETFSLFSKTDFLQIVLYTSIRVIIGFIISLGAALVLGIPAGLNKKISAFLEPVIMLLRSIPVMSVILLALILFQSETVPVFVCLLMAFPILYTGIKTAVENIPADLIEMAGSFNVSLGKRIIHIYVPAILPSLFGSMITAIGISWKVVIAAEVLARPILSIGSGLYDAKVLIETSRVFAWTFIAIIMSALSEAVLILIKRRFQWK